MEASTSSTGASIAVLRAREGESSTVLALERAYVHATRTVGLVAAGFLRVGLLASLSLGAGVDTGRAAAPSSSGTPGLPGAPRPAG